GSGVPTRDVRSGEPSPASLFLLGVGRDGVPTRCGDAVVRERKIARRNRGIGEQTQNLSDLVYLARERARVDGGRDGGGDPPRRDVDDVGGGRHAGPSPGTSGRGSAGRSFRWARTKSDAA